MSTLTVPDRAALLAEGRARMDAARAASAAVIRDDVRAPHTYVAKGASGTSKAAAKMAQPRSGTQRFAVLAAISKAGDAGLTDDELTEMLDINPSTARPRRLELVEGGYVVDSGRKRLTRSSCEATVWVVA